MSAYDQVHKAYIDSKNNYFWDAWGIVASPRLIYELKAECMELEAVHNAEGCTFVRLFGLRVIPCPSLDDKTVYIVDEQLGRTILKLTGRK